MTRKWKVLLEGSDFLVEFEDGVQPCGFWTSRFLEAEDAGSAARAGLQLVLEDEVLQQVVRNDPGDDSPRVRVESVHELDTFGDIEPPGAGFTWCRATPDAPE